MNVATLVTRIVPARMICQLKTINIGCSNRKWNKENIQDWQIGWYLEMCVYLGESGNSTLTTPCVPHLTHQTFSFLVLRALSMYHSLIMLWYLICLCGLSVNGVSVVVLIGGGWGFKFHWYHFVFLPLAAGLQINKDTCQIYLFIWPPPFAM